MSQILDDQLTNNRGEQATVIGHPAGLMILFFTEMWERFSYYGMRALLVLYLVGEIAGGGLGWERSDASQLYAWYTGAVYLTPLLGGLLADLFLGSRRAVIIGGLLMALGHLSLAFEPLPALYLGLILLVLGNGLFKPNISAMVGQLYPDGSPLKDSAYTIFYMGINAGAFLGTILCGYLAERLGWHYGFGAAGIFMVLGLIQFYFAQNILGNIGLAPKDRVQEEEEEEDKALTSKDRDRVMVIVIFSFFTIFFWQAFEQAGSSMNIFAQDYTDRSLSATGGMLFRILSTVLTLLPLGLLAFLLTALNKSIGRKYPLAILGMLGALLVLGGAMGWMLYDQYTNTDLEVPASWFQSLNAFFIITLAPVFSMVWLRLTNTPFNPSGAIKFAFGFLFLAAGFGALVIGSQEIAKGATNASVSMMWLCLAYLFHTMGELCVSPVGLSYVNKLSPKSLLGLMFGVWFGASALANLVGGYLASYMDAIAKESAMSGFFMIFVISSLVAAVLLALLSPIIRRLMHGVE